jgi:hypothetical protein
MIFFDTSLYKKATVYDDFCYYIDNVLVPFSMEDCEFEGASQDEHDENDSFIYVNHRFKFFLSEDAYCTEERIITFSTSFLECIDDIVDSLLTQMFDEYEFRYGFHGPLYNMMVEHFSNTSRGLNLLLSILADERSSFYEGKYSGLLKSLSRLFTRFWAATRNGLIEIIKRDYLSRITTEPDYLFSIKTSLFQGHADVAELLIFHPDFDPSTEDYAIVYLCVHERHLDIVKRLLIEKNLDPSFHDNYLIGETSYFGNLEFVKLLLKDPRVNPSAEQNYAIRYVNFENIELLNLLLSDRRVDPSADDNELLKRVIQYGRKDILKILLADERVGLFDEALLAAVQYCDEEIALMICRDKRFVYFPNQTHALMLALQNGYLKVAKEIMENPSFDPNALDADSTVLPIEYEDIKNTMARLQDLQET